MISACETHDYVGTGPCTLCDGSARQTMPKHFWVHDVTVGAVALGVSADWIRKRFGHRFGVWYRAGEPVSGAIEMVVFTWRRETIETRADAEIESLRRAVREGGAS